MIARVLIVVVLLLGVAGAWFWFPRGTSESAWQGYVDGDFVRIGPPLPGLLTRVAVKAGDSVTEGQLLFVQDDANDIASRDEVVARVAEAEARLANLRATSRVPEIVQAEADVANNRSALERAARDLARAESLARADAISQQQRDQARADALSAAAKVRASEAALTLRQSSTGRTDEIGAQTAVLAQVRAQLAQAEWRLTQRRVTAPAAGLIADILAREGETLNAGIPVVSLLPPHNVLIRFFVPETALAALHAGITLGVTCDSCPVGQTAAVSFVSPHAEYTPPVIYSEATRSKLVYLIEARPTRPEATVLKPGQPVTIRPLP